MKKILENIKSGLVVGFTALVVIIVGGLIYATLSFPDLETVNEGDTLTAKSWNDVIGAINALKGESDANLFTLNTLSGSVTSINNTLTTKVSTLTTNLNTLNGTVTNITTALPPTPNVDSQVSFAGKYYKVLSERYNWSEAMAICYSLGSGRRLPSIGELYYIYLNKSSITGIDTYEYWSNYVFSYSEYLYAMRFNMDKGTWDNYTITTSRYVVCLHD